MQKIVVKYTLIALIITIIWTIVEHFLGYNTTNHEVGQYARMITAFVFYGCVILAIRSYRIHQNNTLTFGEGLKTGSLVSLGYGALVSAWFALYAEVINPQYQPTLLAYERSKLEASKASPEVIAESLKEVEMSSGGSLLSYILLFVFMALFGILVAVIASVIMKRKAKANL